MKTALSVVATISAFALTLLSVVKSKHKSRHSIYYSLTFSCPLWLLPQGRLILKLQCANLM